MSGVSFQNSVQAMAALQEDAIACNARMVRDPLPALSVDNALRVIAGGALPTRDLTVKLRCSRPAVARAIKSLSQRNLITARIEKPGGSRRSRAVYRITDAGRAYLYGSDPDLTGMSAEQMFGDTHDQG